MKDLIYKKLLRLRVFKPIRFVLHRLRGLSGKKRFERDYQDFFQRIGEAPNFQRVFLVVGIMETQRKQTFKMFLETMQSYLPEYKMVRIDERKGGTEGEREGIFHMPRAIAKHNYDGNTIFRDVPEEMTNHVRSVPYLRDAYENLLMRQLDITPSYAVYFVHAYQQSYRAFCEKYRPELVLIWNEFSALHMICAGVCREMGIPLAFIEYGSLPGTFNIEHMGQMGRSYPAVCYEAFARLPVTPEEIQHAEQVITYLRESGLNRNEQKRGLFAEGKEAAGDDPRPKVLFAGQSDCDAGMFPYTEEAKRFHSPIFASSHEAMLYLSELAKTNGWHLFYKPHPHMVAHYDTTLAVPEGVTLLMESDINSAVDYADLVITIMSQTSYVALIRNRPVALLGYNQLRGKGCAYEAYRKEDMDPVLQRAVREGLTEAQKEAFLRHVAQMETYNLYDDLTEKAMTIGQPVESAAKYIRSVLRGEEPLAVRTEAEG